MVSPMVSSTAEVTEMAERMEQLMAETRAERMEQLMAETRAERMEQPMASSMVSSMVSSTAL